MELTDYRIGSCTLHMKVKNSLYFRQLMQMERNTTAPAQLKGITSNNTDVSKSARKRLLNHSGFHRDEAG